MTCVIGIIDDVNNIWMGADSAATDVSNGSQILRRHSKICCVDKFMFGFFGSGRNQQIIEHNFVPPKRNLDISTLKYLSTDFVECIRDVLRESGCLVREGNVEKIYGNSGFVLGYDKGLYLVECNFQVLESRDEYLAEGAGGAHALGSLYSTGKLRNSMTPANRITDALEAAAHNNAYVRGPFDIECMYADIDADNVIEFKK